MDKTVKIFKKLLIESLPECRMELDAPDRADGSWWVDVRAAKRHLVVEYRPAAGFGIFDETANFGEGPTEIYRTPQLAARRLKQLASSKKRKRSSLSLKELRE